jgi:hypothetical protein
VRINSAAKPGAKDESLAAHKINAGSGYLLPQGNGQVQWENPLEKSKSAGPKA